MCGVNPRLVQHSPTHHMYLEPQYRLFLVVLHNTTRRRLDDMSSSGLWLLSCGYCAEGLGCRDLTKWKTAPPADEAKNLLSYQCVDVISFCRVIQTMTATHSLASEMSVHAHHYAMKITCNAGSYRTNLLQHVCPNENEGRRVLAIACRLRTLLILIPT